jgi:hypothetical protein
MLLKLKDKIKSVKFGFPFFNLFFCVCDLSATPLNEKKAGIGFGWSSCMVPVCAGEGK